MAEGLTQLKKGDYIIMISHSESLDLYFTSYVRVITPELYEEPLQKGWCYPDTKQGKESCLNKIKELSQEQRQSST